jgi:hypothetical protein
MSSTQIIIQLAASVLFAGLGVLASNGLPNPGSRKVWALFVVGVLLCANILPAVIGLAIADVGMYSGAALYGLGVGILLGFVLRAEQTRTKV